MAAYGGYVAAQPADLSGIISNFGNKAIAIKEAAKERQEKQDLLEQQKAERIQARDEERAYREQQDVIKGAEESTLAGIKEISDVTADTGQQTYEGLATEATSAVADAIHNIGKDIKSKILNPLEGRVAQQKLVKSFKDFAAGKENFAKGLAFLKEKAPKQSELGKALGAAYFGMGDMPYKTYEITPDKGLILYDKDPKTKKAVPGSAIPTTAFANYQAYEDEEVDYNKQMNDFAVAARTSFAPSGPLAQKKITSEEKNEGYATQRDLYAKQILPSDKDVARYLTQVDGYGIIVQGKQVKQPDKGKPSITLEMTSAGIYEPVVTDTMKTNALESVKAGIDARAKESQQVSRNPNIILNAGGSGIDKFIQREDIKEAKKMKPLITKAKIANDFFYGNRYGEMKAAARSNGIGNPTISDKVDYKVLYGIPKGKTKVTEIARFNTADEAYAYLTGKSNVVEAAAEYQLAKDYATENDLNIQPSPKETLTFDMKAARGMAPGKSDEEIKAIIIKQNPGKRLLWKN